MSNPNLEHYKYLNTIQSYLNSTKDLGLNLSISSLDFLVSSTNKNKNTYYNKEAISSTNKSTNLVGISNSNQGGDLDTRKSTIGNIFALNKDINNSNYIAISQLSKLQKTVAISSAEAKYISLKEATKESLYLQSFIKELFSYKNLTKYNIFNKLNTIKIDSLSAIELAKNPVYHARTKHINITYYFVRENLLSNKIDLKYENTSTILADNLTKATS